MRRVECVYSDVPANKVTLSSIRPAATSTTSQTPETGDSTSASEIARRNAVLSRDLAALNLKPSANKSNTHGDTNVSSNPPSQDTPRESRSCKESSTYYLLDSLASLWADKSNKTKAQILEENKFCILFTEFNSTTLPFLTVSARKSFTSLDEQLPDKPMALGWLTSFLRGPNMLFRICNEEESWRLLDSIYAKEYISLASRCSIWLQLAAGCSFTAGTTNESYDPLFESGCQYLQWCIEQADEVAPLWIIPPMMLSCLYSMNTKPRTCWITLGGAIRVAQVHQLDRGRESCQFLSNEEYERWREVWRAMISFDAWLSMTLGKHPQITPDTTQDSFVKMTLEEFALSHASIEFNIAKLSMLISRFLGGLCQDKMNPATQEVLFHALEEWASKLPPNLRYFPDSGDRHASQADEVGSLYLESFYFASVMTLTKPELFASVSTWKQPHSPHSRLFSQACVDASTQIGHAATTILERGFLCKRSWLITTLVYHAGVVLALHLSAQTTSPRYSLKPGGTHTPEKQGLEANMNVLSACAPHSPEAAHSYKVLQYFRRLIESCEAVSPASTSHQIEGHELFKTPHWTPTPSSWRTSSISTTSPNSTLWQTSPGTMSAMYSCPPTSSYAILSGLDPTIPLSNDLPQPAVTTYLQPSIPDPTYLEWPATLQNEGSSFSGGSKSSSRSHPGSLDSGFEHYKPYMQDFWSSEEAFDPGQQADIEGNMRTQYG